mmetsp:Transcript_84670/g.215581  ORF Transcript_84670/g.215581 Transcript_84670/m.215581 type:complete len:125 (-) Transcript_84670:272-646(-)
MGALPPPSKQATWLANAMAAPQPAPQPARTTSTGTFKAIFAAVQAKTCNVPNENSDTAGRRSSLVQQHQLTAEISHFCQHDILVGDLEEQSGRPPHVRALAAREHGRFGLVRVSVLVAEEDHTR